MTDHKKPHPGLDPDNPSPTSEIQDDFPLKTGETVSSTPKIPQRYVFNQVEEDRVLNCLEAPNLSVIISAGLSISAAAVRKSPPGSIYLDGVAQSEPFLDHEKKIYNFDHHEGCVRSFTFSTCEQVLIMILKGLDLRDREWNIFGNEPDLDTILAIWLLLNHQRVGQKKSIRMEFLYQLVRLEGAIDALGLELIAFTALSTGQLQKTQRVIDYLRREEVRLKKDGLWNDMDYLEYTTEVLHKIDQMIYKKDEFVDFKGIKELARVDLTDNRIVAVVESDVGIYELEPHLRKLYGDRLGLVALKKGPNAYTLRRMDVFMPADLEAIYTRLNFVDSAVRGRTDRNGWGGSADIGGSPRGVDTHLNPREIARACRNAVQKPKILQQAISLLKSLLLVSVIFAAAEYSRMNWQWVSEVIGNKPFRLIQSPKFGFFAILFLLTAAVPVLPYFHRWWQYGIALPAGKRWGLLLPVVILCGGVGGVCLPYEWRSELKGVELAVCMGFAIPAVEFLFRGLVHGILAQEARIQNSRSRWFLSWPIVGSAFLYACFIGYLTLQATDVWNTVFTGWTTGNIFAAFAFGIAIGMVRERSQSIVPAFLFHAIAVYVVMLVPHIT